MSLKTRLAVVFTVMCCSVSSANALELTVWEDYTKGVGLAQAISAFTNETGIDVKVEENKLHLCSAKDEVRWTSRKRS